MGWAAISQEGHGVGTDPICETVGFVFSEDVIPPRGMKGIRTKRASPESTKGFVVNHSHMKALVDSSLTELSSPWMSLLTFALSSI